MNGHYSMDKIKLYGYYVCCFGVDNEGITTHMGTQNGDVEKISEVFPLKYTFNKFELSLHDSPEDRIFLNYCFIPVELFENHIKQILSKRKNYMLDKDQKKTRTVTTIIDDPDEYYTKVELKTVGQKLIDIKHLPVGSNFLYKDRPYFIYNVIDNGETFHLFSWNDEEPEIWKSSEFGMDVLMVEPLIADLQLTRE